MSSGQPVGNMSQGTLASSRVFVPAQPKKSKIDLIICIICLVIIVASVCAVLVIVVKSKGVVQDGYSLSCAKTQYTFGLKVEGTYDFAFRDDQLARAHVRVAYGSDSGGLYPDLRGQVERRVGELNEKGYDFQLVESDNLLIIEGTIEINDGVWVSDWFFSDGTPDNVTEKGIWVFLEQQEYACKGDESMSSSVEDEKNSARTSFVEKSWERSVVAAHLPIKKASVDSDGTIRARFDDKYEVTFSCEERVNRCRFDYYFEGKEYPELGDFLWALNEKEIKNLLSKYAFREDNADYIYVIDDMDKLKLFFYEYLRLPYMNDYYKAYVAAASDTGGLDWYQDHGVDTLYLRISNSRWGGISMFAWAYDENQWQPITSGN